MLTIVEAASSYDLVTAAAAATDLGVDGDAQLVRAIGQASDAIRRWCNRTFQVETLEETFRPACRMGILLLTRFPITEIASIVENDSALSGTDYAIDAGTGVLTRLCGDRECHWPSGKIVVTYKAGYAQVPAAVARAATLLVGRYRFPASDMFTRSVDIPGIMSETYLDYPDGGRLPAEVEALLADYRKPPGF
jgi:hypothetical protein